MHVFERQELAQQLVRLGVQPGGVLMVHTSFRAVRPVLGGPRALIAALCDALGPAGTLVMPTMTDGESPFDPQTTPSMDMGIVAELFWREPRVRRSTHPGGSFAARGPHAACICAEQPLSPPHGPDSPVGRVHALDGQVLLLGVGHSEDTTLHLAEALAGVPDSVTHPCVVQVGDRFERALIAETDHCCGGFEQVGEWLRERGLERVGPVGHARARLSAARDIVDVAREALARDPLFFLCAEGAGCDECDRARASIRRM